jgi:type IV pilus assembly protein PilC
MKVAASLREVVRTGKSLTQGLEANRDLFPSTVRSMVATGEVAGELPNMLESVADAIDDEVDTIVSTLGSRLEVALLMVMGIVVGGLLMVLYLPIINLASAASSGNLGG